MRGLRNEESSPMPRSIAMDKIKKYGWKVIDKPGEFYEINKDDLYVDPAYQRSQWNQAKINRYAAAWSWVNCGTLTVAIRDDKWWVIDGATRKFAADKRSDIDELPCMVYDLDESIAGEASSFVDINNGKTTVQSQDRFKALLVAGDECAVGLNDLFLSTGHKAGLGDGLKTIACLMTIWKLYKRDSNLMRKLWPLIADVNSKCQIRDVVVRGIYWAEVCAIKSNTSLLLSPYRLFLIGRGGEAINAEIKRERTIIGRGGARIEANAIIKLINKSRIRGVGKIAIMD